VGVGIGSHEVVEGHLGSGRVAAAVGGVGFGGSLVPGIRKFAQRRQQS
jgi:hypothetical protein